MPMKMHNVCTVIKQVSRGHAQLALINLTKRCQQFTKMDWQLSHIRKIHALSTLNGRACAPTEAQRRANRSSYESTRTQHGRRRGACAELHIQPVCTGPLRSAQFELMTLRAQRTANARASAPIERLSAGERAGSAHATAQRVQGHGARAPTIHPASTRWPLSYRATHPGSCARTIRRTRARERANTGSAPRQSCWLGAHARRARAGARGARTDETSGQHAQALFVARHTNLRSCARTASRTRARKHGLSAQNSIRARWELGGEGSSLHARSGARVECDRGRGREGGSRWQGYRSLRQSSRLQSSLRQSSVGW